MSNWLEFPEGEEKIETSEYFYLTNNMNPKFSAAGSCQDPKKLPKKVAFKRGHSIHHEISSKKVLEKDIKGVLTSRRIFNTIQYLYKRV